MCPPSDDAGKQQKWSVFSCGKDHTKARVSQTAYSFTCTECNSVVEYIASVQGPGLHSQHSAEFQSTDWIPISINLSFPKTNSMMKLVCSPSRMFSARPRFIHSVYLEMNVCKFSFRLSPYFFLFICYRMTH